MTKLILSSLLRWNIRSHKICQWRIQNWSEGGGGGGGRGVRGGVRVQKVANLSALVKVSASRGQTVVHINFIQQCTDYSL